jgi:hypothetical protein
VTEREGRTADGPAGRPEAHESPPGFVRVPLGKGGCILMLTAAEYAQAIARGKRWRRQEAWRRRIEGTR